MSTQRLVSHEAVLHTTPVNKRHIHIYQALLLSEAHSAIQGHIITAIHTSVTLNRITFIEKPQRSSISW